MPYNIATASNPVIGRMSDAENDQSRQNSQQRAHNAAREMALTELQSRREIAQMANDTSRYGINAQLQSTGTFGERDRSATASAGLDRSHKMALDAQGNQAAMDLEGARGTNLVNNTRASNEPQMGELDMRREAMAEGAGLRAATNEQAQRVIGMKSQLMDQFMTPQTGADGKPLPADSMQAMRFLLALQSGDGSQLEDPSEKRRRDAEDAAFANDPEAAGRYARGESAQDALKPRVSAEQYLGNIAQLAKPFNDADTSYFSGDPTEGDRKEILDQVGLAVEALTEKFGGDEEAAWSQVMMQLKGGLQSGKEGSDATKDWMSNATATLMQEVEAMRSGKPMPVKVKGRLDDVRTALQRGGLGLPGAAMRAIGDER